MSASTCDATLVRVNVGRDPRSKWFTDQLEAVKLLIEHGFQVELVHRYGAVRACRCSGAPHTWVTRGKAPWEQAVRRALGVPVEPLPGEEALPGL